MKHIYGIIFLPVLLLAGCSSTGTALYNWENYSSETYKYVKAGDDESAEELLETYQKIIDGQENTVRGTIPPGVCADYGYILAKQGKVKEGKALLLKEKELYPESAKFIDSIIRRMEN